MSDCNSINMRVEYDPAPIRHIAVQCPSCKRWFNGREITSDSLSYTYQLDRAVFSCPACNTDFGYAGRYSAPKVNITEVGYPEVYAGCDRRAEKG